MKILITGASGFIGSHLVRKISKKHDVVAISRNKPSKLIHKIENITFLNINLIEEIKVFFDCDYIIHAASINDDYMSSKKVNFNDNLIIIKNLLNWAKKNNVMYFLNLSSISIYGDCNDNEISEHSQPINPNAYGQSKINVENILEEYTASNNFRATSIRLSGVVGLNAKNTFIPRLVDSVINKKEINIYSKSALFNNITYIDNIVDYAIKFPSYSFKKYNFFNVASSNPIQLEILCNQLFNEFNLKLNIIENPIGRKPFTINVDSAKRNMFKIISTSESLNKYILDVKAFLERIS